MARQRGAVPLEQPDCLPFTQAGSQLELIRHANVSAVELLKMLLAKDGYSVDVALRGQ